VGAKPSKEHLAQAREAGERGELVRLTPAAVAQLRCLLGEGPDVLMVRWMNEGDGIRNDLVLSEEGAPCLLSYVHQGVRIQIADALTSLLLWGAEVDYVRVGKDSGFAIRVREIEEG
jgi:hypothetical protein